MSKKRFVEFYLAAMMKAATGGKVIRLTYAYFDLAHLEIVRLEYETSTGSGVREIPVNDKDPLEIAAEVIDQIRRAQA